MNYASYEDVLKIVEGVVKKVPQGLMQGNTPVGTITWQYFVMEDYLALDGATINDASIQYQELLSFAKVHSLITTDTTKTYLFQYDETNDILTLPDLTTVQMWQDSIPQIKYRNSTSVFNTVTAGRFVATAPAHYEREQLFTTNKTTITIYPTWVNIDNIGFVLEGQKTIDITNANNWDDPQYITAANRAGKDFYIYAIYNSSANIEPEFILSANSTVPNGYTANNSRKIGGFHCLCLSVGTISGHTLSGYVTGDILPASPWDLSFRAKSENEGMVYDSGLGLWVDIYLASWDGSQLVSVYNGVPVTGTSAKAMHGIMMAEEFGKIGKFLPKYDEFIAAAKGTPEGSHISTDALPSGTGGHIDKSGMRIIGNNGSEDDCGVLWQWGSDHCETYFNSTNSATTYSGAFWHSTNSPYWLQGMNWVDNPVYNPTVDTVKRGSCGGLLRRLVFGGGYSSAVAYCGSRTVSAANFGARLVADVGGRGFSRTR